MVVNCQRWDIILKIRSEKENSGYSILHPSFFRKYTSSAKGYIGYLWPDWSEDLTKPPKRTLGDDDGGRSVEKKMDRLMMVDGGDGDGCDGDGDGGGSGGDLIWRANVHVGLSRFPRAAISQTISPPSLLTCYLYISLTIIFVINFIIIIAYQHYHFSL